MLNQTSLLRRSFLHVVAIGLVLATGLAFGQLPSDNATRTVLDKAVDKAAGKFFAKGQHVGLSIGIYDRGKTVFYDYGTTSKSKVRLPDRKSIYEIASITKTFTGAHASGALVDGKMTLDGDFRAYLKEA